MPAERPSWKVESLTPFTQFTPGTGPVEGKQVNFTTSSGLTDSVFISNLQLGDTAAIAALIERRVDELTALQNLTG